jgi:hypothetical protein
MKPQALLPPEDRTDRLQISMRTDNELIHLLYIRTIRRPALKLNATGQISDDDLLSRNC